MPKMKHLALPLIFALVLLGGWQGARAQEQVVKLFGWSDYIDPSVLEDFTKETGIKVTYDTYNSDAGLEARLKSGGNGYDVVILSAPVLERSIAAGLLQKLDQGKLPNNVNLWPEIMAHLARVDPGNQYAVNYMWYTAGIAFDAAKARDRMIDAPLDSWAVVFRSDMLKKFGDCGIDVIDDPNNLFALALLYLNLNPYSHNWNDLKRAADLLGALRRNVDEFDSAGYIDALANGDICLAVGWSGDAMLARDRASEANSDTTVSAVIPKEGSVLALDNLAIPKNAPHVTAAHALINFLMQPEIAARNTDTTGYASGILAAKSLVDQKIANNKAVYPDEEVMQRLYLVTNHDPATQRYISQTWAHLKAAK